MMLPCTHYIGLRGQCCFCANNHFYYWTASAADACALCSSR